MRQLILEVQMSVDGFMADPTGRTDWQLWKWDTNWNWDDDLKTDFNALLDSVDCILLSRKMAKEGFYEHWQNAAVNPTDPRFDYATKINALHKVVFSKTLTESEWANTDLATGDLVEEVNRLKNQKGKNLIVYGGSAFVSALIAANLIDEYQIFVNPTAIGAGMPVFNNKTPLQLVTAKAYTCGMVVLHYEPLKES